MQRPGSEHTSPIGFWQVLASESAEETVSFRGTTTTERAGVGFALYTRRHFMEIRVLSLRTPPADHPLWALPNVMITPRPTRS